MNKDKFDNFITASLKKEMNSLEVSEDIKRKILLDTFKKETFMQKLNRIMNKTIEIPLSIAVCLFIFIVGSVSYSFTATESMKMDKTLYGITSVKVINKGDMIILVDKSDIRSDLFEEN